MLCALLGRLAHPLLYFHIKHWPKTHLDMQCVKPQNYGRAEKETPALRPEKNKERASPKDQRDELCDEK